MKTDVFNVPFMSHTGVLQAERTRERILDGAMRAIARHGLAKLGMSDVSASAGVSRGTLYRYFPRREDLLETLANRESRRFQQIVGEALQGAPAGAERIQIVLLHATRYVREHPALQRLLDAEQAFVLTYLREQFPTIRQTVGRFLAPLLAETNPVRMGFVSVEQLTDWLTRVMISAVLFPDPDPEEMARALTGVYRMLTSPAAAPARHASARSGRK